MGLYYLFNRYLILLLFLSLRLLSIYCYIFKISHHLLRLSIKIHILIFHFFIPSYYSEIYVIVEKYTLNWLWKVWIKYLNNYTKRTSSLFSYTYFTFETCNWSLSCLVTLIFYIMPNIKIYHLDSCSCVTSSNWSILY